VRRALAILLLLTFAFPAMAVAAISARWVADSEDESQIPACCRKDGKHACAMRKSAPASKPAVSGRDCCPHCPSHAASRVPHTGDEFVAPPAYDATARVAVLPTECEQSEIKYHISFARASQKRGPPPHPVL